MHGHGDGDVDRQVGDGQVHLGPVAGRDLYVAYPDGFGGAIGGGAHRPAPYPCAPAGMGGSAFVSMNEIISSAMSMPVDCSIPLRPGRRVHLYEQGAAAGPEHVHAGYVQPQRLAGAHSGRTLFHRDLDLLRGASPVEVGTELARSALALHGADHAVAYDEGSDVGSVRLLDELLHQYVDLGPSEGLEGALCRGHGLAKYDPQALGPLHQLDDDGRAADHADQLLRPPRGVGEAGDGQADPQAGHDLQRP